MTGVWQQLLSSAIVGTRRRPCRLDNVDGPLATVVSPGALDTQGILGTAAALTAMRRAARRPESMPLPGPAPAETLAPVPAKAAARVRQLIDDLDGLNYRPRLALLAEWLELARARDLLTPPQCLAALAQLASVEPGLRPLVRATGGQRLVWLANQAGWDWLVDGKSEDDWLTGDVQARARCLAATRATDPAAGRALLQEVWPQERAADLAVLIAACAEGLSRDDEAWLEKGLDDRRMQVREAAAALLRLIPGSAYRERAAQRALSCCRMGSDGRIEVWPPDEFDAAMRRDGLNLKPPQGMGEKAWWLLQIVAAAPLECWSTLDSDPVGLIARHAQDDWTGLLRQGWVRAVLRQRSVSWALALTHHPATQGAELGELLAALPRDVLTARAIEMAQAGDARLAEVLQATPAPWPAALTEATLAQLQGRTAWAIALAAERKLDPALALPAIRALIPLSEGRVRDALERLDETLTVRWEMHQEFA